MYIAGLSGLIPVQYNPYYPRTYRGTGSVTLRSCSTLNNMVVLTNENNLVFNEIVLTQGCRISQGAGDTNWATFSILQV